jgi:hypothetical protein
MRCSWKLAMAAALVACFLGGSFSGVAQAAEPPAFQKTLVLLREAQQAAAAGKTADAKATLAVIVQASDTPEHLRWEAKSQLEELARVEKGLPARDPAASRAALPKRPATATTFYVAPDGNDANAGTQDKPFATLERARDAIRQRKQQGALPAGSVEVRLRGGEYRVHRTFALAEQDSGTEPSPIVYRACPGETPRFTGGVRLSHFTPVRDSAVLARLPEESRNHVRCVDLKPLGVKDLKPLELGGFASGRGFRTHPTNELFFDGKALTLARWPNRGFVSVAELSGPADIQSHGLNGVKTGRFHYEGDRPKRWAGEQDAWLYGYWFWSWADSYERIASIDVAKREIALVPPYHTYGYRKGQPFCAVNLLAEIDMPGEWHLDRKASVLYFWPPSDPDKATVELSVFDGPFVAVRDASRIAFEGIVWELGCGDGVVVQGGSHCLLAGCTVRRLGGTGVSIVGGASHGILSCDIHSLGRGAIAVQSGNRKTLEPGRHFVENCHISDLSRIDHTYTPGVAMSGVGNRVAHNLFHDIPSSAMNITGNDHVVEFNEAFRFVTESDDQGAVDMFGDPTFRGNVYRYNFFHHVGNWRRPNDAPDCGRGGIRLDDAISGVLIYGNVFYRSAAGRLGFGGVQIHGGKDNIVDNNAFVDCESAVSCSAWGDARWKTFVKDSLQSPEIDRSLYLARYPELATLPENADRNTVTRSLVVDCRALFRRDSGKNRQSENLVTKDASEFRDAGQGDFRLAGASTAAAKIGFRPIPMEEIGLYRDAFRRDTADDLIRDGRRGL